MSEAPVVSASIKCFAFLGRAVRFCRQEPWPLQSVRHDRRNGAISGEQDAGDKAIADNVGVRGGGKRVILVSRPQGDLQDSNFEVVTEVIPVPHQGEALVKTILISLDPSHRIWASDRSQYMPCVGLGTCMRASAIGRVLKSTTGRVQPGTWVLTSSGVQEYCCVPEAALDPIIPGVPLSLNISLFSAAVGLAAWVGVNICEPMPGQTIVVSSAAGAVGSVAAQLAKARGMTVVGLAGGDRKIKRLLEDLHLDAAINYKTESLERGLARCCPRGVDAYFDSVGGETLDTVLGKMNRFGRIAYCGHISRYNARDGDPVGVQQYQMILMRRIKVQGFICFDHVSEFAQCMAELLDLYVQGKMKVKEDIDESGIEHYPRVVRKLYSGANDGKLMMKVGDY